MSHIQVLSFRQTNPVHSRMAAAICCTGGRNHDPRLRIEHAQVLAPEDIPRFARLGVIPSMQPTHATSDMKWAEARLGPERIKGAYAWRSVLDTGVHLPLSSSACIFQVLAR